MDRESLDELRRVAGEAAGIPPGLHNRIGGESVAEMKADAAELAQTLGIAQASSPKRDERGRFADTMAMSDRIRAQAGYPVPEPDPQPVGSFRVGEGATAAGRPQSPRSMTARIRAAASVRGMAIDQIAAAMGEELGEPA